MPNQRDMAIGLMKDNRYSEALSFFLKLLKRQSNDWALYYMTGQCYRFLGEIDNAIEYLSHAADLNSDDAPTFLALGIAYQLRNQWDDAIKAFCHSLEIDPDYDLAYNSLALTQKKRGELDKALLNYDAGAKAVARRIVKTLQNDRSSPILKHRETVGTLWLEYAGYAGLFLACNTEGIKSIALPTGKQAMEEEQQTEKHTGLYWIDERNDRNETVRLFLPNYFNTFREMLKQNAAYSTIIGNRGSVLELLGRHDEANEHFDDAVEFQPRT
jgi:tetratricopeptide (TPR) repeat protein